ncbi:MAG: hypothetical protein PHN44_01225 [Candidatus Marinimicrobia bacterium]|nr:hypothetical protein [Candidatus Neomarinimicrobiota bacterium]MDD5539084.1 hypothetical protein [Candidatus Neomarinimicrobiota bacterium]
MATEKATPEQLHELSERRRFMGKTPAEIAQMRNPRPAWLTEDMQKYLAELFQKSGGRCVVTGKPCKGKYISVYQDIKEGERIIGRRIVSAWQCEYGIENCTSAFILEDEVFPGQKFIIGELFFGIPEEWKEAISARAREIAEMSPMERKSMELTFGKGYSRPKTYELWLRRYWSQQYQALKRAEEEAESRARHSLGEVPVRPSLTGVEKRTTLYSRPGGLISSASAVELEIRGVEKEPYVFKGFEIAPRPDKPGQFYPVAKITLTDTKVPLTDASGTVTGWGYKTILVDVSEVFRNLSTNARHKAVRLGKPLPEPNQLDVEKLITRAVAEEKE